ncbi:hypothetical protein M9H77_15700 [Catharanthus roseus]|uniref:Uncharacterized protein n=1 Tax=Catharanthus roseus TaxID=4058 RepID=A0ACC0AXV1_CATRO|nr:hypothetical protein M9H77_15700 [Catharanthus roseus]
MIIPRFLLCQKYQTHKTRDHFEKMAKKSSLLIKICSVLMAFLFALSASVQVNDPDWYFWFPLYACGCIVNLKDLLKKSTKIIRPMAKLALFLGIFLFIKVVFEDLRDGVSGIWSVDMRERVVREKIGSGLVIGSMILQLNSPVGRGRKQKSAKYFEYGMAILVGIGYGLSFLFYRRHHKEMKF